MNPKCISKTETEFEKADPRFLHAAQPNSGPNCYASYLTRSEFLISGPHKLLERGVSLLLQIFVSAYKLVTTVRAEHMLTIIVF
jgi:hypothetical protein